MTTAIRTQVRLRSTRTSIHCGDVTDRSRQGFATPLRALDRRSVRPIERRNSYRRPRIAPIHRGVRRRLSGTPMWSWLGLAGLAVGIGIDCGRSGWTPTGAIGLVLLAFGVATAGLALRVEVACDPRTSRIRVRNFLSTRDIAMDAIRRIGTSVAETPLTRAIGWTRIVVEDDTGRTTTITATTGMHADEARDFVSAIAAAAEPVIDVDFRQFPRLRKVD